MDPCRTQGALTPYREGLKGSVAPPQAVRGQGEQLPPPSPLAGSHGLQTQSKQGRARANLPAVKAAVYGGDKGPAMKGEAIF